MANLALEGGPPVRSHPLPFHRPWITPDDEKAVLTALRSGWITSGPVAQVFRETLEKDLNRPVVLTNSCTSALFLALKLVGIQPGDKILLPSFTFAATANVVIHQGGIPVFVDVDPHTGVVTPSILEEAFHKVDNVRGILTVDYGGHPVDYNAIGDLTQQWEMFWISDAAHALGSRYHGRPVGQQAPFTAFSFYATKPVTSGEGGALVLPSYKIQERATRLTLHGLSQESWSRFHGRLPFYTVMEAGYKMNLPDPLAALGLSQYKRLQQGIHRRQQILTRYREALADLSIQWIEPPPYAESNAHLAVIVLNLEALRNDRNWILQALQAEGIQTSVHFIPLHHHPAFQPYHENTSLPLTGTDFLAPRILSLPIFPSMSDQDVDDVIQAFRKVIEAVRR